MYSCDLTFIYTMSDNPNKSSTHLAPYILKTVLLTIFLMSYFTSPWLFCNYQFMLLNLFTFSLLPPAPLYSGNYQTVLCIYESVPVLFVHLFCSLDFAYK